MPSVSRSIVVTFSTERSDVGIRQLARVGNVNIRVDLPLFMLSSSLNKLNSIFWFIRCK